MVRNRSNEKRRTIAAFPSYSAGREPGFYTHMFIEDISTGLMGFRHTEEEHERRIEAEGDEAGKDALKAICTSVSDYPRYHVKETVQSAIESIGTRLAWFGKTVYEICGGGTETSLASVTPCRLFRVPGGFVQVVPKGDRERLDRRKCAFLPSRSAWIIQIPRRLGGARAYRRLLTQLTAVSQPAPGFWTRELKVGRIVTEFDVSDYNRARDAYIARLTRRWGWNRRDSSGTLNTEFFYFFRSLRFRRAQAILRDHIVCELNTFLTRRGINARVRLEGFRSAAEIDDLVERASAGSLHYAEAWRQTR